MDPPHTQFFYEAESSDSSEQTSITSEESQELIDQLIDALDYSINKFTEERKELTQKLLEIRRKEEEARRKKKVADALKKVEEKRAEARPPPPRRNNHPISNTLRELIKENVENGMAPSTAASTFGVCRGSVYKIISENKTENSEEPAKKKKKPGPKSVFDDKEAILLVLDMIDNKADLTLKQIVTKLEENGYETSISSLNRFLKSAKITNKVFLPIPRSWNSRTVIEKRVSYIEQLLILSHGHEVIFITESGFHLSQMRKSKGRSVAGTTCTLSVYSPRQRVNAIVAMSKNAVVHTKCIVCTLNRRKNHGGTGGTNADDFRSFLLDLAPKIPKGSLLVLDNARIHHAKLLDDTWKLLEDQYELKKLFLALYSPFLSPIELLFHDVKETMKSQEYTGNDDFKKKLEGNFRATTAEKCQGFFSHCEKYYEQSCLGLPFQGCWACGFSLVRWRKKIFEKEEKCKTKWNFNII